jgi:hypothetical protein
MTYSKSGMLSFRKLMGVEEVVSFSVRLEQESEHGSSVNIEGEA